MMSKHGLFSQYNHLKSMTVVPYLKILLIFLIFPNISCSDDKDDIGRDSTFDGTLIFSSTSDLMIYGFKNKTLNNAFTSQGYYSISHDGSQFVWMDVAFGAGQTKVHIHNLSNVYESETATVSYVLEETPKLLPHSTNFGGLVKSEEQPSVRNDFVLWSREGKVIGRIQRVHDFAFSPNGKDIVLSAETTDANGNPTGYSVVLIKGFLQPSMENTVIIRQFAAYNELPDELAISPDGTRLVYRYRDHLYTVTLEANAAHKQITTSRFREMYPGWSPDGSHIVFVFSDTNGISNCGEIRIVPSSPTKPIEQLPRPDIGNNPIDDLQPTSSDGKVIISCGSAGISWIR